MSSYLEWKRKALLMGTGGWWLPNNFNSDYCIAAYKFKGASSASDAAKDLTGNGYTLSYSTDDNGNPTFATATGFHWDNSHRSRIHNTSMPGALACVVKYALNASGSTGLKQRIIEMYYDGESTPQYQALVLKDEDGILSIINQRSVKEYKFDAQYRSASVAMNMGISSSSPVYINTSPATLTSKTAVNTGTRQSIGGYTSSGSAGNFWVECAAFYSVTLTATQMLDILQNVVNF